MELIALFEFHSEWLSAGIIGFVLGSLMVIRSTHAYRIKLFRLTNVLRRTMPLETITPPVERETVERLIRSGQSIKAIRHLRNATGCTLKSATDVVRRWEAPTEDEMILWERAMIDGRPGTAT